MIDATVLFLTFTNQFKWGFSDTPMASDNTCIYLNLNYDLDDNWYGPICQTFTNVLRYDTFRGANIGGICQANRHIIEIAETYHPKYVIYPCDFTGIVTEATLTALRKIGCIIVGYFFDDDEFFETRSRWMVPFIDYFVSVIDRHGGIISAYENLGARCLLKVPAPMNPAIFCKLKGVEKLYNATFVGLLKANRADYLADIASHGADVKYLGGGQGQSMHWSKMVEIYNQSRINLNFSAFYQNLNPSARRIVGRVFEVTLSGGFLLTEYAPGLEDYFEIGKEIVCFETAQEAAEKILYYLKHPDEREQIAERGYLRALRDYTGQVHFNRIFSEIEDDLSKRGSPVLPTPVNGMNNIRQIGVMNYFRWVCALRKSKPPLRDEWRAAAELVLNVDPQHKGAKRLLKRAEKWGYPEPFVLRLCVAIGHVLITFFKITKLRFSSVTRYGDVAANK